jgi:hypothetical protein
LDLRETKLQYIDIREQDRLRGLQNRQLASGFGS